MRLFRLLLGVYAVLLTLLLLHPSPFSLFGASTAAKLAPPVGHHFLAFSVLGFLVAASRPPLPAWAWTAALVAYAAGTEALQALVPPRTPSLLDFIENILGIACGTTAWLALSWVWGLYKGLRRPASPPGTPRNEPAESCLPAGSRR